jgi:hypothetical protein
MIVKLAVSCICDTGSFFQRLTLLGLVMDEG